VTFSVQALHVGSVCVPGTTVFWRRNYGEWLDLNLYAFLLERPGCRVLVDAGMTSNIDEINEVLRTGVGERCGYRVEPGQDVVSVLAGHGVAPDDVDYLVLTHLHHDHVGALHLLPRARIVVNRREWLGVVAPEHPELAPRIAGPPPETLVHLVFEAWPRVTLVGDEEEILPGLRVVRLGAHSVGSQAVLVDTRKGTVLLTGDVALVYENLERRIAPGASEDLREAYDALSWIASQDAAIVVPGHDPLLLDRFPGGRIA
jgi:glyoxylase-like metal-dependent hydrolase (beta-lactamase superfamily II)